MAVLFLLALTGFILPVSAALIARKRRRAVNIATAHPAPDLARDNPIVMHAAWALGFGMIALVIGGGIIAFTHTPSSAYQLFGLCIALGVACSIVLQARRAR